MLHKRIPEKSLNVSVYDACVKGQLSVVREFLDNGFDIDTRNPRGGNTLLISAASAGHLDTVIYLIFEGADATLKNHLGFDALAVAKNCDHAKVVDFLDSKVNSIFMLAVIKMYILIQILQI